MTKTEWTALQAVIVAAWPHSRDLTEAQIRLQVELLGDVTYDEAETAINEWASKGNEFAPPPGVIRRLVMDRRSPVLGAGVPTFDEAYAVLYETRGLLSSPFPPPAPAGNEQDGNPWRKVHPLIARFAAQQGRERLRTLPVECPDYGHMHRRDLRQAWERLVDAQQGRELHALAMPAGDRPGELRKLDPLAVIGPITTADRPAAQLTAVPDQHTPEGAPA